MNAPASCRQEPGRIAPVIDRNRCEGKGACVPACPYDVLAVGILGKNERAGLSLVGRIKAFAHGGKQAFIVQADECRACGECVRVCPEQAISLGRAAR